MIAGTLVTARGHVTGSLSLQCLGQTRWTRVAAFGPMLILLALRLLTNMPPYLQCLGRFRDYLLSTGKVIRASASNSEKLRFTIVYYEGKKKVATRSCIFKGT